MNKVTVTIEELERLQNIEKHSARLIADIRTNRPGDYTSHVAALDELVIPDPEDPTQVSVEESPFSESSFLGETAPSPVRGGEQVDGIPGPWNAEIKRLNSDPHLLEEVRFPSVPEYGADIRLHRDSRISIRVGGREILISSVSGRSKLRMWFNE